MRTPRCIQIEEDVTNYYCLIMDKYSTQICAQVTTQESMMVHPNMSMTPDGLEDALVERNYKQEVKQIHIHLVY